MSRTADRALRRWRTDSGRLSAAVLVGGAAFIAAYFLAFDTATKDLLYPVPGMIAPIGVVAGILRDIGPPTEALDGLGGRADPHRDGSWTVRGSWTEWGWSSLPSVADALYLGGLAITAAAIAFFCCTRHFLSILLALSGDLGLSVSGDLWVDLGGFVQVFGGFALTKSSMDVTLAGETQPTTVDAYDLSTRHGGCLCGRRAVFQSGRHASTRTRLRRLACCSQT